MARIITRLVLSPHKLQKMDLPTVLSNILSRINDNEIVTAHFLSTQEFIIEQCKIIGLPALDIFSSLQDSINEGYHENWGTYTETFQMQTMLLKIFNHLLKS